MKHQETSEYASCYDPVRLVWRFAGFFFFSLLAAWLLAACQPGMESSGPALFRELDASRTGIEFQNTLTESHQMNVVLYQDFYSGGGVAIGDINNDDLPDVFLTGNMVPAKLYINQGNMRFRDVTHAAGLSGMGKGWFTGTTMVDIDNDGFLDLFVGRSGLEAEEDRKNLLFINRGDGTFVEQARAFGLEHAGYAVNATFFDYDNDGDLDMYLVNQGPEKYEGGDAEYMRNKLHEFAGDKLFENIGNEFVDVTVQAGIYSSIIGFAHGVAAGDINDDGWEDLFVSNDFFEHDYIYLNNGDKTFTEVTKEATNHISYYSMGNDMADFNNDGLLDIMVLDMVAEDNKRLRENLGGMKEDRFQIALRLGYHYQYMLNVLHLNHGDETFSDIGQLAGVSTTDWSWAPLFADFDNDGWKDLYITNGIRKDIRNIDWGNRFHQQRKASGGSMNFTSGQWDELLGSMPSQKVSNYMYRNNGDLTFTKVTQAWGLEKPSFSNGVAYGDLDNDGDLDLVVNNIDEPVSVFENLSTAKTGGNYIRIRFIGDQRNLLALGTKVRIHHDGHFQYQQHYITRGYRSSMEPVMHFGTGTDTLIHRIEVTWPDGSLICLDSVMANQEIMVKKSAAGQDARECPPDNEERNPAPLFSDYFPLMRPDQISADDPSFKHVENDFDDRIRQSLLPYRHSMLGPALCAGDVNGDGLDDLYLGGAMRHPGALLLQEPDGTFNAIQQDLWMEERLYEDVSSVFLDVDNDGDLDLYVVSGGSEYKTGSDYLLDRIYRNDGTGLFSRAIELLPDVRISGSRVRPADYDKDGDLDLFVGGRLVPGEYPLPPDSYLLENRDGRYVDVSSSKAPQLNGLGMVTDMVWTDIDLDNDPDMVIVGEWMPITIFVNEGGRFESGSGDIKGLGNSSGWWFSIKAHDFDGDGDEDLIAGNLGLNYRYKASPNEPFEIYYHDFYGTGKKHIILAYAQNGHHYPIADRQDLVSIIPALSGAFPENDLFARATIQDIFSKPVLDSAFHLEAHTFASCYIENLGNLQFRREPFDNLAQISSTNDILLDDFDGDEKMDIVMAGNLYSSEAGTIRNDAGIGNFLKGDGAGGFRVVPYQESGLYADGDVKNLALLNTATGKVIVLGRNNQTLKFILLHLPK